MKKSVSLILVLFVLFSCTGCFAGAKGGDISSKEVNEENLSSGDEPLKVALCLEGSINDGEWNTCAYEGLLEIEKNYNTEISYFEMIKKSDMEEILRNYAMDGYDVIYGHGFAFGDAMDVVSKDFPDVIFIINSSHNHNDINLASIEINGKQQGFIAGAVAAMMSETGKVGIIGGMEIPPVAATLEGFVMGAKYVDEDVEVLEGYTGNFEDGAAVKELMRAFIDNNVDVGMAIANVASFGAIEALQEKGLYYVGSTTNQIDGAPENVIIAVGQSYPNAMSFVFKEIYEGGFEPKVYQVGIESGSITIDKNPDFSLPTEVSELLDKIIDDMESGELEL
jgi:basic membrane protein A